MTSLEKIGPGSIVAAATERSITASCSACRSTN